MNISSRMEPIKPHGKVIKRKKRPLIKFFKKIKKLSFSKKHKVSKELQASETKRKSCNTLVSNESALKGALSLACNESVLKGKNTHLGPLDQDILTIAGNWDEVEGALSAEIDKLSGSQKVTANVRLDELREMINYAKVLQEDKFKGDVINKLVNYRLELRTEGISDLFPKSLAPKIDLKFERMCDENGKPFFEIADNFDATVETLEKKIKELSDFPEVTANVQTITPPPIRTLSTISFGHF